LTAGSGRIDPHVHGIDVPGSGGVDSHVHVIDAERFPPPDGPGSKPRPGERATAGELSGILARHGVDHAVVVQLSGYGTDNRCVLDAVAQSNGRWHGIVSLAPDTSDRELDRLMSDGVVGIRFNVANLGTGAVLDHARLLAAIGERGWVAQVQCPAETLPAVGAVLEQATGPVVFDHLGLPDVAQGPDGPGFRWLLSFARKHPGACIKLSGAFRVSRRPFPHADLDLFVEALLEAFPPDRRIWGSDWPFVACDAAPSYAQTQALLRRWLPDEGDRHRALVEAPARLFGFRTAHAPAQQGTA
jgi:predicted TIM-barrel fold metal-dependent hydrolase